MQSNETEREVFVWPDIFRAIGPGDDMVVSAEKLREWLDEREHRKTLEARIDELKSFSRDFVVQHGVVPARSVSVKKLGDRILELQSQLPKKESGA